MEERSRKMCGRNWELCWSVGAVGKYGRGVEECMG